MKTIKSKNIFTFVSLLCAGLFLNTASAQVGISVFANDIKVSGLSDKLISKTRFGGQIKYSLPVRSFYLTAQYSYRDYLVSGKEASYSNNSHEIGIGIKKYFEESNSNVRLLTEAGVIGAYYTKDDLYGPYAGSLYGEIGIELWKHLEIYFNADFGSDFKKVNNKLNTIGRLSVGARIKI